MRRRYFAPAIARSWSLEADDDDRPEGGVKMWLIGKTIVLAERVSSDHWVATLFARGRKPVFAGRATNEPSIVLKCSLVAAGRIV